MPIFVTAHLNVLKCWLRKVLASINLKNSGMAPDLLYGEGTQALIEG